MNHVMREALLFPILISAGLIAQYISAVVWGNLITDEIIGKGISNGLGLWVGGMFYRVGWMKP